MPKLATRPAAQLPLLHSHSAQNGAQVGDGAPTGVVPTYHDAEGAETRNVKRDAAHEFGT